MTNFVHSNVRLWEYRKSFYIESILSKNWSRIWLLLIIVYQRRSYSVIKSELVVQKSVKTLNQILLLCFCMETDMWFFFIATFVNIHVCYYYKFTTLHWLILVLQLLDIHPNEVIKHWQCSTVTSKIKYLSYSIRNIRGESMGGTKVCLRGWNWKWT